MKDIIDAESGNSLNQFLGDHEVKTIDLRDVAAEEDSNSTTQARCGETTMLQYPLKPMLRRIRVRIDLPILGRSYLHW